jgi:hypothetical protein
MTLPPQGTACRFRSDSDTGGNVAVESHQIIDK